MKTFIPPPPAPDNRQIPDLPLSQKERLEFIEFRLYYLGEIRRADLIEQFDIGSAGATRDLALYRQLAPDNMYLQGSTKTYVIGLGFIPIFERTLEQVLSALSHGFGNLPCEIPQSLSRPNMAVLATITRAIHRYKAISVRYCSISSGWVDRELVPHSLVNNGQRWHVRCFDRRSKEFRDFVITRIESAEILETAGVSKYERMESDHQWVRIVELILVPHPAQERPEIIERDYGMVNGSLKVELRAALAGYFLRQWQVDCSPDGGLGGDGYQLYLQNPLALYGVKNLMLAPGYCAPTLNSTNSGKKNDE
ncbi:MAG: WYL domain-containing protein [Candidatus Melainabacteria bacterium]|nr:WYL domain-containing protein [Candidatus Melainabacteria bacterium]